MTLLHERMEFPDDFPRRLERLREASGLTWRSFARMLGVSVRSLYRWRAGAKPGAAQLLTLLVFAAERERLDLLVGPAPAREETRPPHSRAADRSD